jgi:hypothetical protein
MRPLESRSMRRKRKSTAPGREYCDDDVSLRSQLFPVGVKYCPPEAKRQTMMSASHRQVRTKRDSARVTPTWKEVCIFVLCAGSSRASILSDCRSPHSLNLEHGLVAGTWIRYRLPVLRAPPAGMVDEWAAFTVIQGSKQLPQKRCTELFDFRTLSSDWRDQAQG